MKLDFVSDRYRVPAECLVSIAGESIGSLHRYLSEVRVECSRDEASVATLVFDTRRDEKGRFIVQDDDRMAPWESVRIDAVFGSRKETVLCGYIREVQATYPADAGAAQVTVECQDESFALDREHVRKCWGAEAPISDKIIVQDIVSKHKLQLDPDSGEGLDGLVVIQDATDIQFLLGRAEANGYELIVREGIVYFGPMRLKADSQPTIRVYAGRDTNCVNLSVNADGHRPTKVAADIASTDGPGVARREVAPNLPMLGSRSADPSSSGLVGFTWLLSREGASNEAELVALAQKKANEFAMRVRAEGELDGTLYGHVLKVGVPVAVEGIGERLDGTYYVDRVSHVFSSGGYLQKVQLMRNAYGAESGPAVSNALSGIV